MLGDFITRILVMVLGYAYPAFECYKTVEYNKAEIEQLRFWCQYWIIVAVLTISERFGDIFLSWLPMYGEMKLAFLIYLWYPKTKGTSYVYETFLRPYVAKHETDIDRTVLEWRAKAWDMAMQHWQNILSGGQTTFFQILQYLAVQSSKARSSESQKVDMQHQNAPQPPPSATVSINRQQQPIRQTQLQWSASPMTINRTVHQTTQSELVQDHLPCQTLVQTVDGATIAEPENRPHPDPTTIQETKMDDLPRVAEIRKRLLQTQK